MRDLQPSEAAGLTLRRMRDADLAAGLRLTQAVVWSHQLHDWRLHFASGIGWVACDAAGLVQATAMWWPYGNNAATLGLIVVDPSLQGRGVGRLLMQQLLEDSKPRAQQLAATTAGLKLYQQSGFAAVHTIEQRQSESFSVAAVVVPSGVTLEPVQERDLPELVALDSQAFGARREALLRAVLAAGGGYVARRGSSALGFALTRPAGRGTTVGPIIAPDQKLAIALFNRCLTGLTGSVRVDIPGHATELAQQLDAQGFRCVDRVTLMRRGEWPAVDPGVRLWGMVSQALG